jgi:hypothetical protein
MRPGHWSMRREQTQGETLLIRSRHTSATLCGGCVDGCGRGVVASHTLPAPWLQGPATKLWHHNLTTKPATFLVGLWCKCGGCVGQLCGGVVVVVWGCARPHPPCAMATPPPALPPHTVPTMWCRQRNAVQLVQRNAMPHPLLIRCP